MPEDATERQIMPLARTAEAMVLQTNVFPQPPALCRKKSLLMLLFTESITAL